MSATTHSEDGASSWTDAVAGKAAGASAVAPTLPTAEAPMLADQPWTEAHGREALRAHSEDEEDE